MAGMMSVLRIR